MPGPGLVLASGSPRRRELLSGLGLAFAVRPPQVPEIQLPGEPPERFVVRLAEEKARAAAGPGELVLAADTVVVIDGQTLGKPAGAGEAVDMLAALAGRTHVVHTGVALLDADDGRVATGLASSRVTMAALPKERIEWYVGTGEPLDKAGAYAVQGLGAVFVEAIEGNYTNVVGLPLPTVARLFAELGFDLLAFRNGTDRGALSPRT